MTEAEINNWIRWANLADAHSLMQLGGFAKIASPNAPFRYDAMPMEIAG